MCYCFKISQHLVASRSGSLVPLWSAEGLDPAKLHSVPINHMLGSYTSLVGPTSCSIQSRVLAILEEPQRRPTGVTAGLDPDIYSALVFAGHMTANRKHSTMRGPLAQIQPILDLPFPCLSSNYCSHDKKYIIKSLIYKYT